MSDQADNTQHPHESTLDHYAKPLADNAQPGSPLGRIGRYLLRAELGQGTFGVVYRAFDTVLEREVALKVPKFAADEKGLMERFLREARAVARLRHPNVVTVFDVGSEGDRSYIALEHIEGQTLAKRCKQERPSHRQSAQWVRDLALALDYAHQQGVIHRDVKPANIMLDRNSTARLMDFGLAKDVVPLALAPAERLNDPALTQSGALLGTPAYMAPEQARGEIAAIGPRSDLYSLGVVLFELVTGRRPFEGTLAEVLDQVGNARVRSPLPRAFVPDVPLGLEAIILKALAKDPDQRYTAAADLAVDLQRWLKGDPVQAPMILVGDLQRVCPECDRTNPVARIKCVYCNCDMTGVEPVEIGRGDRRAPKRRRRRSFVERPNGPRGLDRIGYFLARQSGRLAIVFGVLLVAGLLVVAFTEFREITHIGKWLSELGVDGGSAVAAVGLGLTLFGVLFWLKRYED